MAVGTPVFRIAAGAGGTTATTGSFTPDANSSLFAFAANYSQNVVGGEPTVTDSLGLTWTRVRNTPFNPGSNRRMNTTLWVTQIGGSPASMTATVTGTTGAEVLLVLFDVTGASTDYSNQADNNNTTGDPSVTLSAVASGSAIIGCATTQGGSTWTPPTGYTEIYDGAPATNRPTTVVYDLTSPGTTLTWSSAGGFSTAIAVELKDASSGTALTASFVSSATTTGTGTIAQTHAISSSGVSSATSVQTATVGQTHALNSTGVSSATTVSQPTLALVIPLTVTSIVTAPTVSNPAIGVAGVGLTANNVSSATTVGTATIAVKYVLTADNISSLTTVSQPSIGGKNILSATSISTSPTVSSPTLFSGGGGGGGFNDDKISISISVGIS